MNTTVCSVILEGSHRVELVFGDITKEKVDAIVNAANTYLVHGGGVAGAISKAGGPTIQQQSSEWVRLHGPVTHRSPAYTRAGKLPCQFIIHAVGPIWGEGGESHKLIDAVHGSLELAEKMKMTTLAIPAISTGIYGFPVPLAAKVILESIRDYFAAHPESGEKLIRIVLYDQETTLVFQKAFQVVFKPDSSLQNEESSNPG